MPHFVAYLSAIALCLLGGADAKPKPQTQPPTYTTRTQKADRAAFRSHDLKYAHLNEEIPAVDPTTLRIATYNIHFYKDLHASSYNLPAMVADVKQANPTVAIFEEVVGDGASLVKLLTPLGYQHFHSHCNEDENLANMIASRAPLDRPTFLRYSAKRSAVAARLFWSGEYLSVVGTHLEVSSSSKRTTEARMLANWIQTILPKDHQTDKLILAGDFNAHFDEPCIQLIRKHLFDVFDSLQWPPPTYTCWAGTRIDFIFVAEALRKSLLGAYIFHTVNSDHLPVIADLAIAQSNHPAPPNTSPIGTTNPSPSIVAEPVFWNHPVFPLAVVLLAVVAVAAGALLCVRRRSKRRQSAPL